MPVKVGLFASAGEREGVYEEMPACGHNPCPDQSGCNPQEKKVVLDITNIQGRVPWKPQPELSPLSLSAHLCLKMKKQCHLLTKKSHSL
jgi:hypothetical protein